MAPAVEFLLHSYPDYVIIDNFPLPSVDDKVIIEKPLAVCRCWALVLHPKCKSEEGTLCSWLLAVLSNWTDQ